MSERTRDVSDFGCSSGGSATLVVPPVKEETRDGGTPKEAYEGSRLSGSNKPGTEETGAKGVEGRKDSGLVWSQPHLDFPPKNNNHTHD